VYHFGRVTTGHTYQDRSTKSLKGHPAARGSTISKCMKPPVFRTVSFGFF